jgi:putative ABC transport system substrate-binding protein
MDMSREWAEAGGLMASGVRLRGGSRRVATLRDKLVQGAKAGNGPVERVMRLDLVINLQTAQALGLTIPPSLLFQAADVMREAARFTGLSPQWK